MRAIKALAAAPLYVFVAVAAQARDLGVLGTVWPIVEPDIRQAMVESAARVDWDAARQRMRDQAAAYGDSLPKRALPVASRTETRWVDPSITASADIQAPIAGPDGEYAWRVAVPAGTRVNPLRTFRPVSALLFFDGTSETQLAFVREVLAARPDDVQPVEAAGANPARLTEKLGRLVTSATDAMLGRFAVRSLPTLLHAGEGVNEFNLGITTFAMPFAVAELNRAFPGRLTPTLNEGAREASSVAPPPPAGRASPAVTPEPSNAQAD